MIDQLDALLESAMREAAYIEAMREGIARYADYRDAIPLIPMAYSRMLLRKTTEFELVAMQWAPGCVSPIHDHGSSRCWVALLDGTLDVENYDRLDDRSTRYARLRLVSTNAVSKGALDHRMNWRELHRVRNTRADSAISLQLYATPLATYTVVDAASGACSSLTSHYDATFDL